MAEAAYAENDAKDSAMGNKRKRTSLDHVGPARTFPRTANMTGENPEMGQFNTSDMTDTDFTAALTQHNNGEAHQNGGGIASAATDTAAAALTAYGNMTVPQPTEMSFANQPTQGASDSFMGQNSEYDPLGQNQQSAGDQSPSGPGSANKPAVGSDEWHKVRRDNHKEGKSGPFANYVPQKDKAARRKEANAKHVFGLRLTPYSFVGIN